MDRLRAYGCETGTIIAGCCELRRAFDSYTALIPARSERRYKITAPMFRDKVERTRASISEVLGYARFDADDSTARFVDALTQPTRLLRDCAAFHPPDRPRPSKPERAAQAPEQSAFVVDAVMSAGAFVFPEVDAFDA